MSVIRPHPDELRLGQLAEVEGDRAESDVRHRSMNGAGAQFTFPQEAQDLASAR